MHRGYLKRWRKAKDSAYYAMGLRVIGLFDVITNYANATEGNFMGEVILPGQWATSLNTLCLITHESPKAVRGLLRKLREAGMISTRSRANRYTVITVCNWAVYQNEMPSAGQTVGQTVGQTEGRPRADQGQQLKKSNKSKNNTTTTTSGLSAAQVSQRETFAVAHPEYSELAHDVAMTPELYSRILRLSTDASPAKAVLQAVIAFESDISGKYSLAQRVQFAFKDLHAKAGRGSGQGGRDQSDEDFVALAAKITGAGQ